MCMFYFCFSFYHFYCFYCFYYFTCVLWTFLSEINLIDWLIDWLIIVGCGSWRAVLSVVVRGDFVLSGHPAPSSQRSQPDRHLSDLPQRTNALHSVRVRRCRIILLLSFKTPEKNIRLEVLRKFISKSQVKDPDSFCKRGSPLAGDVTLRLL